MDTEQVSEKSMQLLENRGYVVWQCSELNNEKIVIVRSRLNKYPQYPSYTIPELRRLCESSSIKLAHEAVKLGGQIEVIDGE